ncbi:MAG: ADOP family duplicated permease [Terriglobales bacterium]
MLHDIGYRLRALFGKGRLERDLNDEMAFHAATTGGFAGEEAAKEACRDARGVSALETLARDIRYAVRSLRHAPGFAIPALLTLALGLGAAIAIFSVADAVLLQPLAYPQANRLVLIREVIPMMSKVPVTVSAPDIAAMRQSGTAFAQVGSFTEMQRDLVTGSGPAQRVETARVSFSLLSLLHAHTEIGQLFTAAQDTPGHNVALLSDALWRSNFGANPGVIGSSIHLDGQLYTIIGVTPPSFECPPRGLPDNRPAAIFVPMAFTPAELADLADDFDYYVVARLRPGATLAEARAQMGVAGGRILAAWTHKLGPLHGLSVQVVADPLRELVVGPARVLMDLLIGAAALLLLLSCANAANLFLVRASTRRREWSLRSALGASGGRLIRQALTESTVLSLAAAACGLALAWVALHALTSAAPATLPQVRAIGLNGWAVLVAAVLALIVGPICGLLPSLAARKGALEQGLREDAPSLAGGGSGARTRQALVVAQVAIAFVLVCGAGLLIHSFLQAQDEGAGVSPQGVETASLLLPQSPYAQPGKGAQFFDALQRTLASQPGVSSVAAATALPTEPNWTHAFSIEGQPLAPGALVPMSKHTLVEGSYFRSLGIPIEQGRAFTPQESLGKSNVVIVSANVARRYWLHGDAVGHRITWGLPGPQAVWLTIVGVAGNVKQAGLDQPAGFSTYEPYQQQCDSKAPVPGACRNIYLSVRGPESAALPLRRLVASVDAEVPVAAIRPLAAVLDASITSRRFNMLLLAIFGLAALLLAAIGLYGVLAFAVSGRKRELAVRMALGADPSTVAGMVVAIGGRLALAGLALGLLCAWLLTGLMRASFGTLLYRTASLDPLTWCVVAAVLLAVALAASYLPARRASRIPPVQALRET